MGLWVQGGGAQTAPSAGNAGDTRAAGKDEVTPTACCPSGGRQTPREGEGPRFVKDPQVTAVCTKHKKKYTKREEQLSFQSIFAFLPSQSREADCQSPLSVRESRHICLQAQGK